MQKQPPPQLPHSQLLRVFVVIIGNSSACDRQTLVILSQPGKGRTCRKISSTPGGREPSAKHVVGEILEKASVYLSLGRATHGEKTLSLN